MRQGIIPALAGNTFFDPVSGAHRRDHPRSRGEYDLWPQQTGQNNGSSPLSRGIRASSQDGGEFVGIIPALAGNTYSGCFLRSAERDHPRSRGEYGIQAFVNYVVSGSSPLSRGIPDRKTRIDCHPGIIPALAGNTNSSEFSDAARRDHPRSRGEYSVRPQGLTDCVGSSPLSRGIPRSGPCRNTSLRIIPALAGNTGAA